jgi:hypothetical protein
MKAGRASVVTGYAPNRISMLMQSPAFVELVEFYRKDTDSVWADVQVRMSLMSLDSLQLLHERIVEDPESMTNPMLLDIAKITADRTGHAPVSRSHAKVDVTVGFADALAEARKREELATKLIEAPRDSWSSDDGGASPVCRRGARR